MAKRIASFCYNYVLYLNLENLSFRDRFFCLFTVTLDVCICYSGFLCLLSMSGILNSANYIGSIY